MFDDYALDNNALRETLGYFANSEAQRKGWVEGSKFCPSLIELACMLFDDTGLSDYVADGRFRRTYGDEAADRLAEFDRAIDCVDKNIWTRAAFESPEMERVRQLARELLRLIPPNPPHSQ
jgi:hypothetical protein